MRLSKRVTVCTCVADPHYGAAVSQYDGVNFFNDSSHYDVRRLTHLYLTHNTLTISALSNTRTTEHHLYRVTSNN